MGHSVSLQSTDVQKEIIAFGLYGLLLKKGLIMQLWLVQNYYVDQADSGLRDTPAFTYPVLGINEATMPGPVPICFIYLVSQLVFILGGFETRSYTLAQGLELEGILSTHSKSS